MMFLVIAVALCLGQSLVHAIELTTGFVQLSTGTTGLEFVGTTRTTTFVRTTPVWPTATVTGSPVSSGVVTLDGIPVTRIIAALPTDGPFATTNPSLNRGSSATSASTLTIVYGPVVVTPPPVCTQTSFRYVTSVRLNELGELRPSDLEAVLSQIPGVTRSSFTTDLLPGQRIPATTTWAQVNIYLPTGVASPTLTSEDRVNLAQCYDPRRFGCPMAESTAIIAGCAINHVATGYPLPVDGEPAETPQVGSTGSTGAAAAPTGLGRAVLAAGAAGLGIAVGAAL